MEESKELQGLYTLFRVAIYVSLVLEFFMYALDPSALDFLGGLITDIHSRLHRMSVYQYLPFSKLVTVMLVIITCIGTKNKKQLEFDARKMVFWPISIGLLLVTLSVFLYNWDWHSRIWILKTNIWFYMTASIIGTVLIHVALDNVSKYFRDGMLKDRFNFENESFEQSEEIQENKYSVNIPMRYYYKGKFRKGWVSISNPFRGTWVVGTPGSGKSYAVVNNYIKQQIEKSFAMYIYDYKFPDLSEIAYNHLLKHTQNYKVKPEFYVINFDDPRRSHRCNPINPKFMADISDAYESAYTIMLNLNKTWV